MVGHRPRLELSSFHIACANTQDRAANRPLGLEFAAFPRMLKDRGRRPIAIRAPAVVAHARLQARPVSTMCVVDGRGGRSAARGTGYPSLARQTIPTPSRALPSAATALPSEFPSISLHEIVVAEGLRAGQLAPSTRTVLDGRRTQGGA
jgi:hypothetical protein